MKTRTQVPAIAAVILILVPAAVGAWQDPVVPGAGAAVADSINAFALDMYHEVASEPGNQFFSPTSLSIALAMTYAGARASTADEMRSVLHLGKDDAAMHEGFGELARSLVKKKKGHEVSIANAVWTQKGQKLLGPFRKILETHYGAGDNTVDFVGETEKSRLAINEWVEKKTKKKIKDLLAPGAVSADTRLVLTNAITFKGKWMIEFEKADTRTETFHGPEDVDARMMHLRGESFMYMKGDGFAAVELPYRGGEASMLILLPDEVDGIADLERSLTPGNLAAWTSQMAERTIDDLSLPRFEMTRDYGLAGTLGDMGMPEAFGPGADFSGMSGMPDLFISAVIHKAFVKVNEEGTEAAAATAVVMATTSVKLPLVLCADHPFVFAIRDTATGTILFMGRLTSPA